jgi:hypothetical protein
MFAPVDVAKVAAILYGTETVCLAAQGLTQEVTPERFVPGAVRLLVEAAKVESLGVDMYLAEVQAAREAAEAQEPERPDEEL